MYGNHFRQLASELSGLPNNPPCTPDLLLKNVCPGTTDEILSKLKDQYLAMTAWTRPSYRYEIHYMVWVLVMYL